LGWGSTGGPARACRRPFDPVTLRSVKPAVLLVAMAAFGHAPLQCSSEPDHSLRRNETPGEALYGLAQQFKTEGNDRAWRETLRYLIERYPNSRYAVMARSDLQGDPGERGAEP
jgi:hypothetical protein